MRHKTAQSNATHSTTRPAPSLIKTQIKSELRQVFCFSRPLLFLSQVFFVAFSARLFWGALHLHREALRVFQGWGSAFMFHIAGTQHLSLNADLADNNANQYANIVPRALCLRVYWNLRYIFFFIRQWPEKEIFQIITERVRVSLNNVATRCAFAQHTFEALKIPSATPLACEFIYKPSSIWFYFCPPTGLTASWFANVDVEANETTNW